MSASSPLPLPSLVGGRRARR